MIKLYSFLLLSIFFSSHLRAEEDNFFEFDEKVVRFKIKQAKELIENGKKAKAINLILEDFRRGHHYPPVLDLLMSLLIQEKKYFLAIKVAHKQLDLLGLEYLQKSRIEQLPYHQDKIKKLSESRLNYIRHLGFLALLYYQQNKKQFKDNKIKISNEAMIFKYATILTMNKNTVPFGHYLLGEIYRIKNDTISSFGNFLLSYEAFKEYPYLIDEYPSAYNFIILHTGLEDFNRKDYYNSSAKLKKYIQRSKNKQVYKFWKKFLKKSYKNKTRIFGKFNWQGHSNPLYSQSTFLNGKRYYQRAYSYDFGFIAKKENDLESEKKHYSFEYLNRSFDSLTSSSNDFKFWRFEYGKNDLDYEYGQFNYVIQYEGINTASIESSDQTPLRESIRVRFQKTYRRSFTTHQFSVPMESAIYFSPLGELEHDRFIISGLRYDFIRHETSMLRIPNFALFYYQFFSNRNNEFQNNFGGEFSFPLSMLNFQNTSFNYRNQFFSSGESLENFSERSLYLQHQILLANLQFEHFINLQLGQDFMEVGRNNPSEVQNNFFLMSYIVRI